MNTHIDITDFLKEFIQKFEYKNDVSDFVDDFNSIPIKIQYVLKCKLTGDLKKFVV